MVPLSKKTPKWYREVADRLHNIGKQQLVENLYLLENYQIVRGKFFYHHYIGDHQYHDLIESLTKEFDMPRHLRHYDIISQAINVLVGEFYSRPDLYRAQAVDEFAKNNFVRQKSKMLVDYVIDDINRMIDAQLLEMGLDPAKADFQSQEEATAYQQQLEQQRQVLTPPEIEKYMKTDWMDAAEMWANHQMAADEHRLHRKELDKVEFEDMLTSARCMRHFFIRAGQNNEETWNPVTTFYHKSPDIEWIQEGDYVGRILHLSPAAVVNRYGHKMKADDIEKLEATDSKFYKPGAKYAGTLEPEVYITPNEHYEDEMMLQSVGISDRGILDVADSAFSTHDYVLNTEGLIEVTEMYWIGFRKIGSLTIEDLDTGMPANTWVDETFVRPQWIREIDPDDVDYEDSLLNTIVWIWQPVCYKAVRISNENTRLDDVLILDAGMNDFQFRSDSETYGACLPVCGRVINNRNAEAMSLVDAMKPDQIGHNVAMNQLYEIQSREVGRFMLFDPNFLPLWKDWAGEQGFEKMMMMAKAMGAAPADTAAGSKKGANFSNFQMVDLDESARMLSRLQLAQAYEQRALARVGITPQRLGSVAASETAEGTKVATTQSFAQTEPWFIRFSEYKQRCLTMGLQLAQFCQSQNPDKSSMMYAQSDMSRAFIEFVGTDLLVHAFNVFVHDSKELIRQLETARRLAIENPNTGADALDLWTLASSNSPREIRNQLEISRERMQSQMQQGQQLEQQKLQQDAALEQERMDREDEQFYAKLDNDLEKEYIRTYGFNQNNTADGDANGIPDMLEYDKLAQKADTENRKLSQADRKMEFDRIMAERKLRAEDRKLAQKDREMADRMKMKQMDLRIAKENKTKAEMSKKKSAKKK